MKQLIFTSACVLGLIASASASNATAVDPNIPGFDGDDPSPTIVQKNTYNAATDGGAVYYGGTGLNGTTNGNNSTTIVATGTNGGPAGTTGGPACRSSAHPVDAFINASTRSFSQARSSGLRGLEGYFVAQLDIASTNTTKGRGTALLSHVEKSGSQRSFRQVVLSRCIGQFDGPDTIIVSNFSIGSTSEIALNDDTAKDYLGHPITNITTGTWYINVRNQACPATGQTCDVLLDWLGW